MFDEYKDLLCKPFSVERHKAAPYPIDLEAVIAPDGTIEYAIPSHQEYLIAKTMEKKHWSRQELMDACPKEYYANFLEWLIQQSGGYLPIWPRMTVDWPITHKQAASLRKLKMAGLFKGAIPQNIMEESKNGN